jgi:hypothetical protein
MPRSLLHDDVATAPANLRESLPPRESCTPRDPTGREAYPTSTTIWVTNTSPCNRRALSVESADSKDNSRASILPGGFNRVALPRNVQFRARATYGSSSRSMMAVSRRVVFISPIVGRREVALGFRRSAGSVSTRFQRTGAATESWRSRLACRRRPVTPATSA